MMRWYLLEFTIGYVWKSKYVQACDSEDAKSKLPTVKIYILTADQIFQV